MDKLNSLSDTLKFCGENLSKTVNDDWRKCLNILKESLKINSPEYRELMEIKDDVYHPIPDEEFNSYMYNDLDPPPEYTSILAEAAKHSLVHLIAVFLKNKVSVCQHFDMNKSTMLHEAAGHGQYELVKLLLSLGATVNAKNSEMETALHLAAQGNYPHVVEVLLENGANIDSVNRRRQTPFMVFHSLVQKRFTDKNTYGYSVAKLLNKYDQDRLGKKKY